MKHRLTLVLVLAVSAGTALAQEDPPPIRVELNATETAQGGRCRLTFVVENKADQALDSLKLDLAVFGKDGAIQRRLLAEMGPVRQTKMIVKAFELEGVACDGLGAVLVNDVMACTPGEPGRCLDRPNLTSRLPTVRLFK